MNSWFDWRIESSDVSQVLCNDGIIPNSYEFVQLSRQQNHIEVQYLQETRKILGIFPRKVYGTIIKELKFTHISCTKTKSKSSYGLTIRKEQIDYIFAYHIDDKDKIVYWKVMDIGKPRSISTY